MNFVLLCYGEFFLSISIDDFMSGPEKGKGAQFRYLYL